MGNAWPDLDEIDERMNRLPEGNSFVRLVKSLTAQLRATRYSAAEARSYQTSESDKLNAAQTRIWQLVDQLKVARQEIDRLRAKYEPTPRLLWRIQSLARNYSRDHEWMRFGR